MPPMEYFGAKPNAIEPKGTAITAASIPAEVTLQFGESALIPGLCETAEAFWLAYLIECSTFNVPIQVVPIHSHSGEFLGTGIKKDAKQLYQYASLTNSAQLFLGTATYFVLQSPFPELVNCILTNHTGELIARSFSFNWEKNLSKLTDEALRASLLLGDHRVLDILLLVSLWQESLPAGSDFSEQFLTLLAPVLQHIATK